jgi:hypothetical protein
MQCLTPRIWLACMTRDRVIDFMPRSLECILSRRFGAPVSIGGLRSRVGLMDSHRHDSYLQANLDTASSLTNQFGPARVRFKQNRLTQAP